MKLIVAIQNCQFIIIMVIKFNKKTKWESWISKLPDINNGMLQLVTYELLRANRYMSCFYMFIDTL